MGFTRRQVVGIGATAGATLLLGWRPSLQGAVITRALPGSGGRVPAIGLGTRNYRVGEGWASDTTEFENALRTFFELGGRVIDSAPSYGDSEAIVGEILSTLGRREETFLATKVDRPGREEGTERMEASLRRLKTDRLDLMQVHNLRGWQILLPLLRGWKASGRIRYLGVTTSGARQYPMLADIMTKESIDFVQLNYSIDRREAADRLLPLAADRGMGVLINLPFGRGRLFRLVTGQTLPSWAEEFDCSSWGQFFLKYVISHPAVTCVIPGMTKARHVTDNLGALRGRLPTPDHRRRMERLIDGLS